jgi:hypothetical protein
MGEVGTLTMSAKELNRLEVLGRVLFVRLDEDEEDGLLGAEVFYSNYSDAGYFISRAGRKARRLAADPAGVSGAG